MTKKSYWQSTASLPQSKKLTRDVQADVAVTGGGITGITAAYLLKKAGRKVALLERDRCARVDTGHTTAHPTYFTFLKDRLSGAQGKSLRSIKRGEGAIL